MHTFGVPRLSLLLACLAVFGCSQKEAQTARTLTPTEAPLVGIWRAEYGDFNPKTKEQDLSKRVEFEFLSSGNYIEQTYSDDKRTFLALQVDGAWASDGAKLSLKPARHTVFDKVGNISSKTEIVGESIDMALSPDGKTFQPPPNGQSYFRFTFRKA